MQVTIDEAECEGFVPLFLDLRCLEMQFGLHVESCDGTQNYKEGLRPEAWEGGCFSSLDCGAWRDNGTGLWLLMV